MSSDPLPRRALPATIDLSADVGESYGPWQLGDDAALLPLLSSAHIACGLHAGDPHVMRRTLALARRHGVAVGAHPGFADLAGFGRRPQPGVAPAAVRELVLYQLGALAALAADVGVSLRFVKAHGALALQAAADDALAAAIGGAIATFDPQLAWVVMPGTALERAGQALGLPLVREVYLDRGYGADGRLLPRSDPAALLRDAAAAADRAMAMLAEGAVIDTAGRRWPCTIDSICVHGDGPDATALLRALRAALAAAGVAVAAPAASAAAALQAPTAAARPQRRQHPRPGRASPGRRPTR